MKGGTNQNNAVLASKSQAGNTTHQAKIQPTAEQIRYAKLAQLPGLEDSQIQEKIKEVCEVTGKTPDVVSVALHESNYEVSLAIQNIFDGNYDCLDTEWQTRPTKKKKTPAITPVSIAEKNQNGDEVIENHVNEEENTKSLAKPSKSIRGGKRGGRPKRLDDNADVKNIDDDVEREREQKSRDGYEKRGGIERGQGRPRGRGRGGMQRGGGNRRGGFGGRGGNFGGPGRGSRGRGRGFAKRTRYDQDNQFNSKEEEREEPFSEEKESWDMDEDVSKSDWADVVEAEEKSEGWSQDQWITPVSEDNTASLFANSIMSSSAQVDNWSHVNGPDTKWGRTSPKQQEESLYRPENVDAAVIMSQRAQPSSESAAYQTTDEHSMSTFTSSLHDNQFPSSHQDTSLSSSLLGRTYHMDDLAKVTMKSNVSEASKNASPANMISGVHDSHTLEQEQLQPPKAQRQPRPKRASKSQTPSQPVEMPKSTMEEIEQQLGGLEFGSGPISPKFGTESKPSFSSNSPVTTPVFQQSSATLTSTIHHETVRHSVAIPEVSSKMATASSLTSTNASKNERPKTPPGLSSLQEHQSPGRHFSPSSPRDLKRLVQMPDPIPFPPNSRPSTQSMTTTSLNQSADELQSALTGSFESTRNVLNSSIVSAQESNMNIVNDPRSLSSQPMLDLGELPLGNHIQQNQGSSAYVGDTYGAASINKTLAQSTTAASFTKQNIAPPPGVLPSSAHVTYSSSTLASQVLGLSSTQNTTAAQTAPKALVNTSKSSSSGPPGMLPMNIYAGMQQMPTAYPTYSFEDMQMLQRMPMHSYYDVIGSNFQAGDSKFARDASSPVASTMNTGNPHAAHAQQQAAFLGAAAATPLQYGYAYYGPGMIPGTFPVFTTAPLYQMQGGKAHMGGMQYQSAAYNTQHGSHAYNSGGSQDFEKGTYHRTGAQPHNKNGQTTGGTLSGGSTSTENIHHSGFKSQFNQDTKGYQLTPTPPSMNIPLPHGQNHMTSYAPYMMPHHASMIHQSSGHLGHQQLDSANQGSLASRTQHHSMATSQQQKRDVKAQGFPSSYWPGNN